VVGAAFELQPETTITRQPPPGAGTDPLLSGEFSSSIAGSTFECTVNADGRVIDASALRGDAPLSDAAVKAAKKWRYEPLVVDGKRRAFVRTVRVNFMSEETLRLGELIESLSSRYESVRESAATVLGGLFKRGANSRDGRWVTGELRKLIGREQSPRAREAAQNALARLGAG
jgi:TonB family protein